MAIFERPAGAGVAERVRPAPGSDEEKHLERLAADRTDGWRKVPGDEQATRPAQSAPKADWVAYAITRGISREEAEAMTKAELIELTDD